MITYRTYGTNRIFIDAIFELIICTCGTCGLFADFENDLAAEKAGRL